MHSQSITAPASRQSKRQQLREIVSRLGESATPAQIREECYRVGFGAVNGHMLVMVRNEIWPNRKKHAGGAPKASRPSCLIGLPESQPCTPNCPNCNSTDSFVRMHWKRVDGNTYRKRLCKNCGELFATVNEPSPRATHSRRLLHIAAIEKQCSKCKKILPVSEFGKKSHDGDLYRSQCKDCMNYARRVNYGTRSIQSQYGLTVEEYREMLAQQGGVCAICGKPEGAKRKGNPLPLGVDHCHKTGRVRGLLCNRCNLAIGNFDDDVGRMRAALDYLQNHESGPSKEKGGPSCQSEQA